MSFIIDMRGLRKKYDSGEGWVLDGIDLTVMKKDFIAIMGRSGCGKTTFLKTIGLIQPATEGSIRFGFQSRPVDELSDNEISDLRRRKIGYVFQNYNLMNSLTVRENIVLPAILDKRDEAARNRRAEELIRRFGIEELKDKYPYQLSGGEQQRAALCRALINDPELILGDEPTGNLDSKTGKTVIDTLSSFNRDLGKTVLIVTHDAKIARQCRTVIFMKDGRFIRRVDRKESDRDGAEFYQQILVEIDQL